MCSSDHDKLLIILSYPQHWRPVALAYLGFLADVIFTQTHHAHTYNYETWSFTQKL